MKKYNEEFLGTGKLRVPLPTLSESLMGYAYRNDHLRESIYLDYLHYTLVMNKITRQLIFAASNINQEQLKQSDRGRWNTDSRILDAYQLDNVYYKNNRWDRGHMVRRANNAWGENGSIAQQGSNATMYYTNASFQHENFNQDEWLGLEEIFKNYTKDKTDKLSIFTGPVYCEYDRHYSRNWHDTVRIPGGFFKVICYENMQGELETRAFVLYQDDEALKDKKGRRNGFNYRSYQVTITELEMLTGLEFSGKLYDSNPLYFNDREEVRTNFGVANFPEHVLIDSVSDIVSRADDQRTTRIVDEKEQMVKIIAAMINPEGYEIEKEWITLFNISSEDIQLDGWKIREGMKNGQQRSINLDGKLIKGGESLKLQLKDFDNGIRLNNNGNSLTLLNEKGHIVDSKSYTERQARYENVAVLL